MDLPEGWKVERQEAAPQKEKKELDTRMLWGIFAIVFIAVIAFAIINQAPPEPVELTTVSLNGIDLVAEGDPLAKLAMLPLRGDLVGEFINPDHSDTASNALLEIGEVLKTRTALRSGGTGYKVRVGVTERTGIFIHDEYLTIEGADEASFWRAVWVFSGLMADSEIVSDFDLWAVSGLFEGRENVSVVVDMNDTSCTWGKISSALGNINGALGYLQSEEGFLLKQWVKEDGECELQFTSPDFNTTGKDSVCPGPGNASFVITFKRAEESVLTISGNETTLAYKDCNAMIGQSLILRDVIAPGLLTGLSLVEIPTYF